MEVKEYIRGVFGEAQEVSFEAQREIQTEEQVINTFLDAINNLKGHLADKASKLESIIEKMEHLTWCEKLDDEALSLLYQLILTSKDIKRNFIIQYISFNHFRQSGIALKEINDFKHAIDDFQETYSDLEDIYFKFPKDKEFLEVTEELSA
jgi:hypothetical protein